MSEPVLRVLFVALCGAAGLVVFTLQRGGEGIPIVGVLAGLAFGLLVVALERRLRRVPGRTIHEDHPGRLLRIGKDRARPGRVHLPLARRHGHVSRSRR